jgi:hypothetical protein
MTALGEEVATTIGGLHFVADGMCQRHLGDLPRDVRVFHAPVAERWPEAVRNTVRADAPQTAIIAESVIGPDLGDWEITSLPSTRASDLSNDMAPSFNGTLCPRPPFMRSAGIVQIFVPMSTSAQVAWRTSPERAAVRMANSRPRAAMLS